MCQLMEPPMRYISLISVRVRASSFLPQPREAMTINTVKHHALNWVLLLGGITLVVAGAAMAFVRWGQL